MSIYDKSDEFWQDGLCFSCREDCSACCGGGPGYVWLDGSEVVEISRHLGLHVPEFLAKYARSVGGEISLRERGEEENWNCVFLENGLCKIYSVRPMQCRTYPFWEQNLVTESRWQKLLQNCPGAGEGRRYSPDEIIRIMENEDTVDSVKDS